MTKNPIARAAVFEVLLPQVGLGVVDDQILSRTPAPLGGKPLDELQPPSRSASFVSERSAGRPEGEACRWLDRVAGLLGGYLEVSSGGPESHRGTSVYDRGHTEILYKKRGE